MTEFHSIKPDVPEVLRQNASPIEKYLLDQSSKSDQQNRFLYAKLEKVLEQTTATNGRVTKLELEAVETWKVVSTVKKLRGRVIGAFTLALPIVYLLAQKAVDYFWK